MIETEIVIVGAGLTGLCTARYLEKLGINYILLDKYIDMSRIKNNHLIK